LRLGQFALGCLDCGEGGAGAVDRFFGGGARGLFGRDQGFDPGDAVAQALIAGVDGFLNGAHPVGLEAFDGGDAPVAQVGRPIQIPGKLGGGLLCRLGGSGKLLLSGRHLAREFRAAVLGRAEDTQLPAQVLRLVVDRLLPLFEFDGRGLDLAEQCMGGSRSFRHAFGRTGRLFVQCLGLPFSDGAGLGEDVGGHVAGLLGVAATAFDHLADAAFVLFERVLALMAQRIQRRAQFLAPGGEIVKHPQ
jgi:hypothetical protein